MGRPSGGMRHVDTRLKESFLTISAHEAKRCSAQISDAFGATAAASAWSWLVTGIEKPHQCCEAAPSRIEPHGNASVRILLECTLIRAHSRGIRSIQG